MYNVWKYLPSIITCFRLYRTAPPFSRAWDALTLRRTCDARCPRPCSSMQLRVCDGGRQYWCKRFRRPYISRLMRWKSPMGSAYGSEVATFPSEMKELRCCLHHTSGCDTPSLHVSGCGSRRTVLGDDVGENIGISSIISRLYKYFCIHWDTFPSSIFTVPSAVSLHIWLNEYLGELGSVWFDLSIRHHACMFLTVEIVPNGLRKVCYVCCKVCVALAVGSCLRDEDLSVQPCNRPGPNLTNMSPRPHVPISALWCPHVPIGCPYGHFRCVGGGPMPVSNSRIRRFRLAHR